MHRSSKRASVLLRESRIENPELTVVPLDWRSCFGGRWVTGASRHSRIVPACCSAPYHQEVPAGHPMGTGNMPTHHVRIFPRFLTQWYPASLRTQVLESPCQNANTGSYYNCYQCWYYLGVESLPVYSRRKLKLAITVYDCFYVSTLSLLH